MGYRHQVISDTTVPRSECLPHWFKEKYKYMFEFDRDFWVSKQEYTRYGALKDFNDDVKKVVIDLNLDQIRLIYFADEDEYVDISHVLINKNGIYEMKPAYWEEYEYDYDM